MNIINKIRRFFKSFKYAFKGVTSSILYERNMRIHMCAAFYVLTFMQFYDLSASEKAIIFLTIGSVISLEIINTAIEAVVDLCSPDYHPLAKKAKDLSAGAVLISAMISVLVAFEFFWDISTFQRIYSYFIDHILLLIGLVISLIIWILFIFTLDVKKHK